MVTTKILALSDITIIRGDQRVQSSTDMIQAFTSTIILTKLTQSVKSRYRKKT